MSKKRSRRASPRAKDTPTRDQANIDTNIPGSIPDQIPLSDETFDSRRLAAYEVGRLLNCFAFHFIQGFFEGWYHKRKAEEIALQLAQRARLLKNTWSEKGQIQAQVEGLLLHEDFGHEDRLIAMMDREIPTMVRDGQFVDEDNGSLDSEESTPEEVDWTEDSLEPEGPSPGQFIDQRQHELDSLERDLLSALDPADEPAFHLGKLVDEGIRPEFFKLMILHYRLHISNINNRTIIERVESEPKTYPPGRLSPSPDWLYKVTRVARELGITMPRYLVPSGEPAPCQADYPYLVEEIDRVIRGALLGRGSPLPLGAPRVIESSEYQRLLDIKKEVDSDVLYIGESIAILEVFETINYANMADAMITILGPSGSGKTALAELIHRHSARKNKRFGSYEASHTQGSDELAIRGNWCGFGANSGFSTIPEARTGILQDHAGGTIFLDEVHDVSPVIQLLLLTVIDGKPIQVVAGTAQPFKPNVRLIFASNRELSEEAKADRFKHDLWRRVRDNYIIRIPPLADRKEDIFLFIKHHFIEKGYSLDSNVYSVLLRYDWPGNIGQLLGVFNKAKAKIPDDKRFTLDHLDLSDQGRLVEHARRLSGDEAERDVLTQLINMLRSRGFQSGRGLQTRMKKFLKYSPATISRLVKKHRLLGET